MGVISRNGALGKSGHHQKETVGANDMANPKTACKRLRTMMGNMEDTLEELQKALLLALKAADPAKLRCRHDFGRRIKVFLPQEKLKFQSKDGKGEWMEGIVLNYDASEGLHKVMFNGDHGHEVLWDLDLEREKFVWLSNSIQDYSVAVEVESDTSSCTDGCGWGAPPEADSSFFPFEERASKAMRISRSRPASYQPQATDSSLQFENALSEHKEFHARSKRKQSRPNRSAAE